MTFVLLPDVVAAADLLVRGSKHGGGQLFLHGLGLLRQRELALQRARLGEERLQAAFGSRSLWKQGRFEEEELPRLSKVCLNGWGEDGWDGEIPTAVFLRGMVAGENDAVMPCLLQVLLRLPAMLSWLKMHAEHCSSSRGCALCW